MCYDAVMKKLKPAPVGYMSVRLWRFGKFMEITTEDLHGDYKKNLKMVKSFMPMLAIKRGYRDFGRERYFAIWVNREKIFFKSWPIGQ